MRVLFISHGETSQAHERPVILATQGGVDLAVVAPRVWKHPLRELRFDPVNTEHFAAFPLEVAFNGDIYRYVYRGLGRVIRKFRPDVIHVEDEPCAWSTVQVLLLRRLLCPAARMVGFSWENLHLPMSRLRRLLERYSLRNLDFLVCGNHEAQDLLRLKGFRGPTAVSPQWGVSLETYRRMDATALRSRLGLREPVIGYVGRMVEAKGLRTLLRAAAALKDGSLLLIGSGPMAPELPTIWRELGAPFPLVQVEAVPHAEVPQYLSAMDLFVLPSETTPNWKEQFGHVLIEAMACEVPVIGSDSGEIPRVIGDAGRVFHEGDAADLASHLQDLAADPTERRRLARAGYERVHAEYELARVTLRNVEVYRQVLRGSASGVPAGHAAEAAR